MNRARGAAALLASAGLHAWALAHALVRQSPSPPVVVPASDDAPAAVWAGETFDIDAISPESESAGEAASSPPRVVASPAPERREVEPLPPRRPAAPATQPATQPAAPPREASSAQGSSGSDEEHPAGGRYGQAGPAAVAAPLGKGLLRVLPRAAFVESKFHELGWGATARLRFSIDLDQEGRPLPPPHFEEHEERVPWLEALLGRSILLLRAGTFALPEGVRGPVRSRFELTYEVTQGQPATGDWLEPRDLAEIGRLVEPTASEPGRAHFRYNSGREVRLTLRLL